MATKQIHLVWNTGMSECVGFDDKRDADYTATGSKKFLEVRFITPTIGEAFRECYGDEAKRLPQTSVEVPA